MMISFGDYDGTSVPAAVRRGDYLPGNGRTAPTRRRQITHFDDDNQAIRRRNSPDSLENR
jgi:hypothetical protein